MKIYVHYDSSGRVQSVVTLHGTHVNIPMPHPKAGFRVAEVEGEVPTLPVRPTEEDVEKFREQIKKLRVEGPAPLCKLVPRK